MKKLLLLLFIVLSIAHTSFAKKQAENKYLQNIQNVQTRIQNAMIAIKHTIKIINNNSNIITVRLYDQNNKILKEFKNIEDGKTKSAKLTPSIRKIELIYNRHGGSPSINENENFIITYKKTIHTHRGFLKLPGEPLEMKLTGGEVEFEYKFYKGRNVYYRKGSRKYYLPREE